MERAAPGKFETIFSLLFFFSQSHLYKNLLQKLLLEENQLESLFLTQAPMGISNLHEHHENPTFQNRREVPPTNTHNSTSYAY